MYFYLHIPFFLTTFAAELIKPIVFMKRLFVYLACLTLVLPSLADSSAPVNQTFQPVQHKCAPNKSLFFKIEGLSLSADSGTVISPFIMQASCLQQSELSAPSELINVTDRVEA